MWHIEIPLPTFATSYTVHFFYREGQYTWKTQISPSFVQELLKDIKLIPPNAPARAAPPKNIATRQLRSCLQDAFSNKGPVVEDIN